MGTSGCSCLGRQGGEDETCSFRGRPTLCCGVACGGGASPCYRLQGQGTAACSLSQDEN